MLPFHGSTDRRVLERAEEQVESAARAHGMSLVDSESANRLRKKALLDEEAVESVALDARGLGAQLVVTAQVIRVDGAWMAAIKVIETQRGQIVDSRIAKGANTTALLDSLKSAVESLF